MSTRRDGREWIVQLLFQLDMNTDDKSDVFAEFWADKNPDVQTRTFTEAVVNGVLQKKPEIDALISRLAKHWTINRMSVIDRNVIRMCIYEIMERTDVPAVVAINEAVDIAKYFSSTESGKFVNGILDKARKELEEAGTA